MQSLSNKAVLTINTYGENLILGVYGMGLVRFNPKTGKTRLSFTRKRKKSKLIFATYFDEE